MLSNRGFTFSPNNEFVILVIHSNMMSVAFLVAGSNSVRIVATMYLATIQVNICSKNQISKTPDSYAWETFHNSKEVEDCLLNSPVTKRALPYEQ